MKIWRPWNKQTFIKMTWFGVKWPETGWYAVKQNDQPTNPPTKVHVSVRVINNLSDHISGYPSSIKCCRSLEKPNILLMLVRKVLSAYQFRHLLYILMGILQYIKGSVAQSAGALEYTDCFSAEE